VVNRGAAIFGDKIYFGTLDARLIALDKNTGKVVWNKKFGDHAAGYTMTGAPVLIKDKVSGKVLLIHGSSGDEFGVVGQLFARDPDTGEEVWMRPFVEGHMGRLNGKDSTTTGDVKAPSWPDDPTTATGKVEAWSHGGGAPWQSASFDAETNTIIVGAGNPGPWNTWARTAKDGNPHDFDSLYTSGQVGVDPSTGEVKWFYQHTPNDAWDFSGNNELVLFDYKDKDGKVVKATGHADRNGFFYVVDRNNGKLQNAFPFVDNITKASVRPSPCRVKPKASRWKSRRRSWGARTGTPWPTARTPACSTSRATSGKRNTGPKRSTTRRARRTWAWVFASSACMTTTSAPCGR
jgi:alcohol dehydrogenase (cytochrome c)